MHHLANPRPVTAAQAAHARVILTNLEHVAHKPGMRIAAWETLKAARGQTIDRDMLASMTAPAPTFPDPALPAPTLPAQGDNFRRLGEIGWPMTAEGLTRMRARIADHLTSGGGDVA